MSRLARPLPLEVGALALLPVLLLVVDRAVASLARAPGLSLRGALVSLGLHAAAVVLAFVLAVGLRAAAGPSRGGRAGLVAVVAVAASLWMARSLVGGAWISTQAWAPALPWLVAALAGVAAWGWTWMAEAGVDRAESRSPVQWLALVGPLLALPVLDALVEPARFPRFHLWLYGAQVGAGVGLARCFGRARGVNEAGRARRRLGFGAAIGFNVLAIGVALWPSERTRAEVVTSSPTLARFLRLAGPGGSSYLRPALEAPAPKRRVVAAAPAGLGSLSNANILLVSVDALRADTLWPARRDEEHPCTAEDVRFMERWLEGAVVFRRAYAPASTTQISMPLTFHSLELVENPYQVQPRLGPRMNATGRHTLAVANAYFGPEAKSGLAWLVDGFDAVRIHDNDALGAAVPQLLEGLDAAGDDQPFFAWLHLFSVHEPGFDGRPLDRSNGSWPRRYCRALRWTDARVEELVEGLERRGLVESTIIVFTSDHGEGLGDNGVPRHGKTIFEEEVRVPLAIFVPGLSPRVVETPARTIDVLPTVLDLVGERFSGVVDGRSLTPALAGETMPSVDVQLVNRTMRIAGLVRGTNKLVWDHDAGVPRRFDLSDDPREEHDLFSRESPEDAAMMVDLVRAFPQLFAHELDDPLNAELLVRRLRALDDDSTRAELNFLVGLAVTHGDGRFVSEVEALLERSEDERRRKLLERRLKWGLQEPYE